MSVVLETTLGDITIDLYIKERPQASLNFIKLCKIKYFHYNLFHTISRGFIAQTGDPTGSRNGGESVFGIIGGPLKRYFEAETNPRIKHTTMGLVSFVGTENKMIGSQFFITLGTDLTYLDDHHCIFGEVMEGLDVLELLNETICDQDNRPYQDVRITHTVILDDPFPDLDGLILPSRSPSPSVERLQGGRIAPDEEIDETQGKSMDEVNEIIAAKEAKARATILEMIGDIPDADMAPPENVLFVCKLNPVTTDDDLEIIFSRFGKVKSCEVIRDKKTAESLQYAFVEFEDRKACEDAYFKMDNVLIDDRRIHVDFSQSVAKIKWFGKGKGIATYDDHGRKINIEKYDAIKTIQNLSNEPFRIRKPSRNFENKIKYLKRDDKYQRNYKSNDKRADNDESSYSGSRHYREESSRNNYRNEYDSHRKSSKSKKSSGYTKNYSYQEENVKFKDIKDRYYDSTKIKHKSNNSDNKNSTTEEGSSKSNWQQQEKHKYAHTRRHSIDATRGSRNKKSKRKRHNSSSEDS